MEYAYYFAHILKVYTFENIMKMIYMYIIIETLSLQNFKNLKKNSVNFENNN